MNTLIIFCRKGFFLLILFVFPDPIHGANYYIDQNHSEANDQNTGTIDKPWKTIIKANQTLIAGDTVFIRAGTYTSYIAPVNSGTSAFPVVFINYRTDKVIISNTSYGVYLNGKSFIKVQGISFYNLDKFLWLTDSAHHNSISYCNFDKGRNLGWSGSKIYRSSTYNWLHHCRFSDYGFYADNVDKATILDIGNEYDTIDFTCYNLIEDNIMFHGGHHILGVFGMFNVIRNNYFHNEPWSVNGVFCEQCGNRNIMFAGYIQNSGRNLLEGNRIGYGGSSGVSLTTSHNIIRFNSFYYSNLSGLSLSVTSSYVSDIIYNKIYHNTFFHNGVKTEDPEYDSGIYFAFYSGDLKIEHNAVINNLLYSHLVPYSTYRVDLANQIFDGNWNGDLHGDPLFVYANKTPGDPDDPSNPNLRLKYESPCKDKGTYLTTITSAGGTGNSFTVADAGYFIDGWGIKGVTGDEIQIFRTSQKARILSVDYSTRQITVDKELTWTQNQGVCLSYEGNTPDPGAFECRNYPSGLEEYDEPDEIVLFPNPTTGLLTISFNNLTDTYYNIEIYSSNSSLLESFTKNKTESVLYFDISNYLPGLYLFHFVSENSSFHFKLIKL